MYKKKPHLYTWNKHCREMIKMMQLQKRYTSNSWIGRLNIAKMSILHKLVYSVKAITVKISAYFQKNWQVDLDCIRKCKGIRIINQSGNKDQSQ